MKINSNTIKLEKNSFEKLEEVVKKIASENKIENVGSVNIKLSKNDGVVKFAIEDEGDYLYDVIVHSQDGEHTIEKNLKSYEEAKSVADEWLGSPATWQGDFQAISSYGDKLFIEKKKASLSDFALRVFDVVSTLWTTDAQEILDSGHLSAGWSNEVPTFEKIDKALDDLIDAKYIKRKVTHDEMMESNKERQKNKED